MTDKINLQYFAALSGFRLRVVYMSAREIVSTNFIARHGKESLSTSPTHW